MSRPRIAINGFGRIGRNTLRAYFDHGQLNYDIVALNDLMSPKDLAFLFKHDSVMGPFEGDVSYTEKSLVVNGTEIKVFAEKDPANLPWKANSIDVVLECTGFFTDATKAKAHIDAGAKKVIISAPAKNEDGTFAVGINHESYNPEQHHIISNASCTTNCLAPMAKIIHEAFGIKEGFMTTIHSYTGDQRLLDAPHSDLRRARAAALNMVPTTTGAAKAIGLVMPDLKGKLDGFAIRVPTPDVSLVDLVVVTEKPVTAELANQKLRDAAQGPLNGVLRYCDEPLVSSDFIGDAHSCIVDSALTMTMGEHTLKVVGWYDNEWGYSNRLLELTEYVGQRLPVTA
ncbi:MAG: type I glyceraldehyde-3-phosphate dehydrogenase [Cyanobacteria bacterium HKST-UBA06]|nr:type I glyceraldehyde-3-phosphate dehydrogenase [Cyanobacteria bacterium HKST-UBA04]MCA9806411.1 type I glyceraldehyde-3-phosphate dehydrogenase [Cyanobacteria bacterium HKST-UBA06]MCA9841507.1 type I glyceraldehyde-3-phosphate dehydrogenase [Cyanobacteria bacterium HKST-UBA03]